MIRRQPSSTLTDTSFPSPRLFRSEQGSMFDPGPCMYMEKIATGPQARDAIDLNRSPTENLKAVAAAKGESVRDLTAVILDRKSTRSELQSLMRISYAVFCLKTKKDRQQMYATPPDSNTQGTL